MCCGKIFIQNIPYILAKKSKWFEPRSISSSYSVIVWVSVVLKRTVGGDLIFLPIYAKSLNLIIMLHNVGLYSL